MDGNIIRCPHCGNDMGLRVPDGYRLRHLKVRYCGQCNPYPDEQPRGYWIDEMVMLRDREEPDEFWAAIPVDPPSPTGR